MKHSKLLALAALSLFSLSACGGDTTDDGGGTTDEDTGAVEDAGGETDGGETADAGEEELPEGAIRIRLVNRNPGGQTRWVQTVQQNGNPGWWTIVDRPLGAVLDEQLDPFNECNVCDCDDLDCEPCELPAPAIVPLATAESVEAIWDGNLWDRTVDEWENVLCDAPLTDYEPRALKVQFCWSSTDPGEVDQLNPALVSCVTQLIEEGQTEVVWNIEGLATCGDLFCDPGESMVACPEDCPEPTRVDSKIACFDYCTAAIECGLEDAFQSDDVDPNGVCQLSICQPLVAGQDGSDLPNVEAACGNAMLDFWSCVGGLETCDDVTTMLGTFGGDPLTLCTAEFEAMNTACPAPEA